MNKKIINKLFIYMLLLTASSLVTAKNEIDYRFELLTTQDGLPSIEITKIFQQKNGFIWIGTDRGVSRFDGVEFKHYFYSPGSSTHISNNFINDILEDRNGNLWISTEDGLNRISPSGEIAILKSDTKLGKGMPTNWTTALHEDQSGVLWVGTGYGLFSYHPQTEKFVKFNSGFSQKIQSSASVYSIVENQAGEIIVASTIGIGVVNRSSNLIEPLRIKNKEQILYDSYATALLVDEDNQLLVATETDGLLFYNFDSGAVASFKAKLNGKGILDNSLTALIIDGQKNLWIAYANHGLSVHSLKTGKFQHVRKREFEPFSLPSDSIRNLFIDKSGLLWIGTADGIATYSGLTKGTKVYFKRPDGSELSSDTVYHIFKDNTESMWMASENGLMLLDLSTKKIEHFPLIDEKGNPFIYQEVWRLENAGDTNLWLATENGLLLFNKETQLSSNISKQSELPDRGIYTLLGVSDSSLWLTGYMDVGLIHFDLQKGVLLELLNDDGSKYAEGGNFTSDKIIASDGSLVLATTDGVFRVDSNHDVTHYPLSENRDFIRALSIIENIPGEFWMASVGLGIVKMDVSDGVKYKYFNTSNGFPSNEIKGLLKDGEYLWFVTKDQLFRMELDTEKLESFPNLFSVSQLTFLENSLFKEKNILYLGSSRGVISIDVTKIEENQFESPVKITSAMSGEGPLFGNLATDSQKVFEVDYVNNDMEISFASLDYSSSQNTLYSYRLVGLDDDWSKPSKKRTVSYNNLGFGDYIFKVRGTNSGGKWSKETAEINFTILKPWWFYLIIGLAATTFLTLVIFMLDRRRQLLFLHEKAHVDTLTGISNRFSFNQKLDNVLSDQPDRFGLAIIDLDGFKEVNDTFGHHVGDTFLLEVTNRIKSCIRTSDYLARLGGDEFALIMTQYKRMEDVIRITERIKKSLRKDFEIGGNDIGGSCSIGVAVYPQDGADPDTLLSHADAAMYEAKKSGKNRVFFFNENLSETLGKRLKIRANLKTALSENQFKLYYQPKINQFTNQIIGAEALIRWIHPDDGFIPPDEFISEAESNGTILDIGEWVFFEACKQARIWQEKYDNDCRVSVNVSAVQIAQPNFVSQISDILKVTEVDPALIELEITESVLIESRKQCQKTFAQLKELGLTIALDDFGVGFSSLSYLTQFSIDTLKIDRSFVSGLRLGSQNYAVLKNIYSLARDLNMEVVAEGVEEKSQLEILAQFEGALVQGYFYSPPVKPEELKIMFETNKIIVK